MMETMEGFFNQLLRIDLSNKKSIVEPIPDSILRTYLGGKGLGSYLLLKENPPISILSLLRIVSSSHWGL
jgi:aldehyde:ferredoxin oxidoreductase